MEIIVKESPSTLTYESKGIYRDRTGRVHGFATCNTCGEHFETFGLYEELALKLVKIKTCYNDYQESQPKGNFMELKDIILGGLSESQYQARFGRAWNE